MKKLGKIFLVVLSVLALVAVTAFAISAAEAETGTPNTFAVPDSAGNETIYESWQEAIKAATDNKTYTIKLNGDWTVSETADAKPQGYSAIAYDEAGEKIKTEAFDPATQSAEDRNTLGDNFYTFMDGKDWVLDLNGKTVNVDMDGILFYLYSTKLTITGGGTIDQARQIVRLLNGAKFSMDANQPITINPVAHGKDAEGKIVQQGRWCLFVAEAKSGNNDTTLDFKGKITVNPVDHGVTYFEIAGAKEVNFDSAIFKVNKATNTAVKDLNKLFSLDDSGLTTVNVLNGSRLELNFGIMFSFGSGTSNSYKGNRVDLTGWLNHFPTKIEGATVPDQMRSDIENLIEKYKTDACIINASNSTFVSDPCSELAEVEHGQGQFIRANYRRVKANFTNCKITAGGRAIYGDDNAEPGEFNDTNKALTEGYYKFQTSPHMYVFKDCEYTHLTGAKSNYMFTYGANAIWDGGKITGVTTASMASAANYYYDKPIAELDYFYGVKFSNVKIVSASSFNPETAPAGSDAYGYGGCGWGSRFVREGNYYTNYTVIEDGKPVKYKVVITSADSSQLLNYALSTGDGATMDYRAELNADGTSFDGNGKTNDFHYGIRSSGEPSGNIYETTLDNGNNIIRIDYLDRVSKNKKYFEIKGAEKYPGMENKFYVFEFDLSSTKLPETGLTFTPQNRTKLPMYDNDGNFLALGETVYGSVVPTSIDKDGNVKNTDIVIPEDGTWVRFTLIEEIRITGAAELRPIQEYKEVLTTKTENGKETTTITYEKNGTETVNIMCVPITVYHHVFINGVHAATSAESTRGYNGWIPEEYSKDNSAIYFDGYRIQENSADNKDCNLMFDNIRSFGLARSSSFEIEPYTKPGANINGVAIGNTGLYFNEIASANIYGNTATEATLNGMSITLNEGANINATFTVDETWLKLYPDAKLVFSNGTVLPVIAGKQSYTVALTPAQINKSLSAKIVFGDKVIVGENDISVSAYKKKIEASAYTYLGISLNKYNAIKSLLDATVTYSSAANLNSGDLVTGFGGFAGDVSELTIAQTEKVFLGFSGKLSTTASITLRVDETKIKDGDKLTVAVGGTKIIDAQDPATVIDGSLLVIDNLRPGNFNDLIEVTLGESKISFTLETYLSKIYDGAGTNVKNMIVATYNYGRAAEVYNGIAS